MSIKKQLEKQKNWLEIKAILQKISQAGFQAFIVGGAVREALLNQEVKEIDLVSSAKPDTLLNLFPQASDIFKKYNVLLIPLTNKSFLEVVSFRKDSAQGDGRRPESVDEASLKEDSQRRDFTINALYYNIETDEILDFSEGQKDLKEKKIKTIGKAQQRFQEDYLRMLRALRFESQLGFQLEPDIELAIKELKEKIKDISFERIRDEIHKIFSSGKTLRFIRSLKKHGLYDFIFPRLNFNKTISYLNFYEDHQKPCHELGLEERYGRKIKNERRQKPCHESGLEERISLSWLLIGLTTFYDREKAFDDFLKKYRLSSHVIKGILKDFNSIKTVLKRESSLAEKCMAFEGNPERIYHVSQSLIFYSKENQQGDFQKESLSQVSQEQLSYDWKEFQKRAKNGKLPKALVTGFDLLKTKRPKESFSKILKQAYHLQLTDPQLTKEEILKQIH